MKNLKFLVLSLVLLTNSFLRADEGMWLPLLLGRNYEDMKKHGLNLSPEEIYSINNSSLKDAIVWFGGFCTGEVISGKGLVLTNHHCGYDAIAEASTKEKNYLDNGFWAKNTNEEIPVPGLFASFVVRIEDVTEKVLSGLNDQLSESERKAKVQEIMAILTKDAKTGTHYEAVVKEFFDGNEYFLFVYEKYNDVRLVGTPPQSAGKYGGDTDNWMWPRHTADFSMFRVYADANNKPAAYSAENKPLAPRHSLPLSLKGVKENDFAMILGFPGSTNRYLTSWGVKQAVELEQPKRVDVREKKLNIMKKYMDKDVTTRLNYSSTYAQVANYWKYFIGQTEQVKKNNVIQKKEELEAQYTDYLKTKRMAYPVLEAIKEYYELSNPIVYLRVYQSEFIYTVDANVNAFRYSLWANAMKEGNDMRANAMSQQFNELMKSFFEKGNMELEGEIIHKVFSKYCKDISLDQQGPLTQKIAAKGKKGIAKYMKKIQSKSIFLNKDKFEAFAANPSLKVLEKDPLYLLIVDMNDAYNKAMSNEKLIEATASKDRATRAFVAGIQDMFPDKKFYPNANSTMRLTYGQVLPYSPKDGVTYHYYTTLDGVMQKEDPTNPEFVVDARIKELWKSKDYGQYADQNGDLVVNFLSNNDITGGNSGSPVINGDGHLVGCAFDGNWEAMSGDIFFEKNIQRTISLDIRYVLWLIDKCYGANNLIDEMKLVK